jgi:two-component system, sensor histidine kinase PhcS
MLDRPIQRNGELHRAFLEEERSVRVANFRIACLTAFVFMPAGSSLDILVYPQHFKEFLFLRLVCSALLLFIWWFVTTPFGARHYQSLGLILPGLPTFFISLMIYQTEQGAQSVYYAGLNLVLLGAAMILRWSLWESLIVCLEVLVIYFTACWLHQAKHPAATYLTSGGVFYNNSYFLVVTGAFVVIGSHFYNKLRFREFSLRYELDLNKKQLEANNQQLDRQNKELADTIRKLTEAESQLVQSEKMASLGRMSAGIIHEINNPLNFATTGIFTLKKKTKHVAPDQQAEYADILKDVEDGITRVKNIVSDLRLFTHPSTENLDQVEAADVVASALRFLSNELKDRVTIEVNLSERQLVRANKNKLIHVFVNLVQNSLDALRLKSFADGEKPTIWIAGRTEKGASVLVVRDNGPGISTEHLGKIFDPFFTTKEVGQGMGLGLSICYRIILESSGKISVRSEPGKFCEFTLEFPDKL